MARKKPSNPNNCNEITASSSQVVEQKESPNDQALPELRQIFNINTNIKPDVFVSPLCYAAEFLLKQGIAPSHLRAALLTLVTLNSAHLGAPMALAIKDEGGNVINLINACRRMLPEDFTRDFDRKVYNGIKEDASAFNQETIVGIDPELSLTKKEVLGLSNLIESTVTANPTWSDTHISWLFGLKDTKSPLLSNPHVHIEEVIADPDYAINTDISGISDFFDKKSYDYTLNTFKEAFKSLKPYPVEIPFIDLINKYMDIRIQNIG